MTVINDPKELEELLNRIISRLTRLEKEVEIMDTELAMLVSEQINVEGMDS